MELFNKLADEVLEASERISTRFEEGLSVLLDGELPKGPESNSADGSFSQQEVPISDFDDFDLDGLTEEEIQRIIQTEMMDSSPLEGIADSVISDITSKQASQ